MLSKLLMLGAVLWIGSEVLELAQGGYTPENSSLSVATFAIIAVGIWTLWAHKAQTSVGKTGVALISLGMALFSATAIMAIIVGAANDAEISDTPLFLAAGTLVSLGALALTYWLVRDSGYPKIMGYILLAATAFTLGVAFVPAIVGLQPLSNIVLAAILGFLGYANSHMANKSEN